MNCPYCAAETPEDSAACGACGATLTSATDDVSATGPMEPQAPVPGLAFAPGQSFGDRYTIVEEVGSGGMGLVYKAIDRELRHTVALKLIRPRTAGRPDAVERFRRELALAQQVTHPNVCRLHDLGEVEGVLYISMPFVEGQTLDDLIQSVGHLSPSQTIALGRQICAGLQAIHERAIVHRDLKPGNVMVDRSGHALLMDFGMAFRQGAAKITREGAVLGTLAYLSPEQALGLPIDPRTDLYALGLILFEMLTGRRAPGDAAPAPLALRDRRETCPPPSHFAPEVPPALDAVVLRCLERDPVRRFGSADDLERALTALPQESSARLSGRVVTPSRTGKRPLSPAVSWTASTVAALAVAWAIWEYAHRPPGIAPARPATVAVLPLAYEGPETQRYLKDAVPVLIGEALRAAEGIQVAPFDSSRGYSPDEDPRSVAKQLGVAWVVRGRLSVHGDEAQADLAVAGTDGGTAWKSTERATVSGLLGKADATAKGIANVLGARPPAAAHAQRSGRALDLYLRGKAFLEGWDVERSYAKAEELFRDAIAADGSFAEAHAGLARALRIRYDATQEAQLVERAAAEAQRAVALAPTLPEAHVAMGVVQLWRGQSAEAELSFGKAQRLAPADDSVCRYIAEAYDSRARDQEAEQLYQRAIDLRPGYWDNYNAKGKFYARRGQTAPAKEMFSKVIDLRPESSLGYNNKAAVHITEGELDMAEPLLVTALRLNPDVDVLSNLGFVHYGTGRFEEAAREFRQAIDAGAEKYEAYSNLGDAYRQLRRSDVAREAYARAIDLGLQHLRINPNDAIGRAGVAMAMAGAGRCGEAKQETALALAASAYPLIHYYAAVAYAVCGDRSRAVAQTAGAIKGGAAADVRTNPDLRPLLDDPSIRTLLR